MIKIECTRGFGKVVNPLNGEEIDVQEPLEVDKETFKALDAEYPGFRVVEDEPQGKESEDGDEEYLCGYNGCERKVSGPEETCWQHPD